MKTMWQNVFFTLVFRKRQYTWGNAILFGQNAWLLMFPYMLVVQPLKIDLQQPTLKMFTKNMENLYNCSYNYWKKLKTFWPREKCFQKSSAADASNCVYRWERVNVL